ncbi:MAG: DUF4043 family protein [Nitrospirae bacterium]|nr:MAG: DUF4043 family protein [Nitrospirota bacterium]
MAYTEVLTDHDITPEQWDDMCFKEYIGQLFVKFLMGTNDSAVIQVKEELTKKSGDAITFNFGTKQTGGVVRGNTKGIGNEGKMDFYGQRVTIDNVRVLHKIWDIPMSQKRTNFNILNEAKHALTVKAQEVFEDDTVTALTDTSVGRVQGRYLYGSSDSNWDATHSTALQNIDNTNDQLSSAIISMAKRKAKIPANGADFKIRPMRVKAGKNYEEWYILLAHDYAIRDLVNNDAAFRNAQLLLPPGSNANSILYNGSAFKGSWEGVLIYEYERIPLVSSNIQVAHNLLMGAQAGAVAWGQRSKFGEEFEDLKHNVIYELHEIRGIAKLVRNGVDHGIVNVFTAAVAD